MLWPHCLHDWIWYFSHGCRQRWRSLGMCDRRALWPPRLRVFLSCLGPKDTDHHTTERLLQVLRCVTNRSRQPPTRKAENDNLGDDCCPLRSPVKAEHFPLLVHFRRSRDCLRPESGRACGWEHVMYMSIGASESVPLVMRGPSSARLLLPSAGLLAEHMRRRRWWRRRRRQSHLQKKNP